MRIFISGGCKNGKSTWAQKLAKKQQREGGRLYYLATMIPHDGEDRQRVARHRQEREGWGFETVEAGKIDGLRLPQTDRNSSLLLDSVTALLANEMFREDGSVFPEAYHQVEQALRILFARFENIVAVSDGIYSDAFIYDELTERYRQGLAHLDRALAGVSDIVLEACFGKLIAHKGEARMREITDGLD